MASDEYGRYRYLRHSTATVAFPAGKENDKTEMFPATAFRMVRILRFQIPVRSPDGHVRRFVRLHRAASSDTLRIVSGSRSIVETMQSHEKVQARALA